MIAFAEIPLPTTMAVAATEAIDVAPAGQENGSIDTAESVYHRLFKIIDSSNLATLVGRETHTKIYLLRPVIDKTHSSVSFSGGPNRPSCTWAIASPRNFSALAIFMALARCLKRPRAVRNRMRGSSMMQESKSILELVINSRFWLSFPIVGRP